MLMARYFILTKRLETVLAFAIVLLGTQLAWLAFDAWLNRPRPGMQVAQQDGAYPYLVYLPETSHPSDKESTLLLYLHGSGSRGSDLDPQRLGGPAKLLADGKELPMIVVSPQCPAGGVWEPERLRLLLERLQNRFRHQRIVVTGYSMGGGGTWDLVQAFPDLIDAAAPVCGCGVPSQAERLKEVPIWAFHGELDDVIPVGCSREMVEAINTAGGTAMLTILPNQGHSISRMVYNCSQLYEWLLNPRQANGDETISGFTPTTCCSRLDDIQASPAR